MLPFLITTSYLDKRTKKVESKFYTDHVPRGRHTTRLTGRFCIGRESTNWDGGRRDGGRGGGSLAGWMGRVGAKTGGEGRYLNRDNVCCNDLGSEGTAGGILHSSLPGSGTPWMTRPGSTKVETGG